MGFNMDDYVEVPERIKQFRERYPNGSLQSSVIHWPSEFLPFIAVEARAFRTPDDPTPGVGLAWENFPGKTPYTKDSELMNSETSAWGRALIAVGAADAKKIASAQEVRRSGAAQHQSQPQARTSAGVTGPAEQALGGGDNPASVTGKGSGSDSGSPPSNSKTCAHVWRDAPRQGFEVCATCGEARRKEKAVLT